MNTMYHSAELIAEGCVFVELDSGFLEHHGIMGQKWGKRNGPPYPLDAGDHSISERKAGWEKSLSGKTRQRYGNKTTLANNKYYEERNSETHSDNSQAALFVARLALHTVSLNPVGMASDVYTAVKVGQGFARSKKYAKERSKSEIDKKTGFALKHKEMSDKEDLARVNPSFHNFNTNTKSNCMLCTSTYDMRKRGYDVTAKTASAGFLTTDIRKWYPKAQIKTISGQDTTGKTMGSNGRKTRDATDKFIKEALSQGEGARGNIMVTWAGFGGGHSMVYEVKNGKVAILDAQSNQVFNDPYKILKKTNGELEYARLDNVDFNAKEIQRCCK